MESNGKNATSQSTKVREPEAPTLTNSLLLSFDLISVYKYSAENVPPMAMKFLICGFNLINNFLKGLDFLNLICDFMCFIDGAYFSIPTRLSP
jgi:hypothetical protein